MPEHAAVDIDLRDVVLTDSRGGGDHAVGRPGIHVLTLLRHRY